MLAKNDLSATKMMKNTDIKRKAKEILNNRGVHLPTKDGLPGDKWFRKFRNNMESLKAAGKHIPPHPLIYIHV